MFEDKSKSGYVKMFLIALLTSLGVAIVLFFITSDYIARNAPVPPGISGTQNNAGVPAPQQLSVESAAAGTPVIAVVAKSASPGVVGISVLKVDGKSVFDTDLSERWGVGSGVIVSDNGYILTNHHVAGGKNKRLIVSLADGRNLDGVTKWSDPVLDLAVVKINASNLTPISLGDANTLEVGEPAIAIGNPLGLQFQRTVTSGIVSALNRTIRIDTEAGTNYMEDLIQTDASINPGNSGGPLLNSKGQVVGINTVKVESAEAIGFAIPINVAVPIIRKFVDKGEFNEPYIGVFAYDREIIPYLDSNIKIDNGIYVANVDEAGPAYKSGIRVGCIIKQADGNDMNTMLEFRTYMYSRNPGDTINITHIEKGTNRSITVPIKLNIKEKDGLLTR